MFDGTVNPDYQENRDGSDENEDHVQVFVKRLGWREDREYLVSRADYYRMVVHRIENIVYSSTPGEGYFVTVDYYRPSGYSGVVWRREWVDRLTLSWMRNRDWCEPNRTWFAYFDTLEDLLFEGVWPAKDIKTS